MHRGHWNGGLNGMHLKNGPGAGVGIRQACVGGLPGIAAHQCLLRGDADPGPGDAGRRDASKYTGGKQHGVRVVPGSLLHAIAGKGSGQIVRITRRSTGWVKGSDEIAVLKMGSSKELSGRRGGRPFMLAVQWHPERMYVRGFGDRGLYGAIRDRFIEEIKKSIAK